MVKLYRQSATETERGEITHPEVRAEALEANNILYQIKTLGSNVTTVTSVSDLSFSNLEIGKIYRLSYSANTFAQAGTDSQVKGECRNNGALIPGTNWQYRDQVPSGSASNTQVAFSVIFEAAGTTMDFHTTSISGTGASLISGAYIVLEELPNHTATTKWT